MQYENVHLTFYYLTFTEYIAQMTTTAFTKTEMMGYSDGLKFT